MRLQLDRFRSPIGALLLIHDQDGVLRGLDFEGHEDRADDLIRRFYRDAERVEAPAPRATRHALEAYFDREFDSIAALPFATGGTEFQRAAWAALRTIPPGATRSYAEQATAIGRPKAVRAIGLANGANPIAIATPCHRVIGANGSLTGFGGGLHRKRWLLIHEGAILA